MKRFVKGTVTLLSLSTVVWLSGCGAAANSSSASAELGTLDPANPTKITFYTYSLAYPTMKPGMEQLIKEFNDTVGKEKGVIVEGIADTTMQQYKADISAGKEVDVVQHTFSTLDSSRLSLGFQAYEDVFPQEELDEHLKGISPNALELGKIDGKMYGLAFTFSTPIVFINGKLFEEAGLDPENPPKTWDEIKEASLAIKEKTGKDGFGLAPNNGWITEGLILSNGGEVLAKDRSKVNFANEAGIEAISMWKDLYHNGASAAGTDTELSEQFMAGNLGMYVSSTSLHSGVKQASEAGGWKLYGAGLPQFGDKPSVPVNSGSVLAVRPDSPEKNAAVWEFIKFVTGDRGYTIITSQIGYLPLRTALADDPNGLKDFVEQNPLYKINLEQLSRIQPVAIWPGDNATEIFTVFYDAIVKAVSSDEDAATVLKQAEDEINGMIQ
ncbi:multiple sugar transport system substrate-binding protein [Paenibacillus phyllosphaerae]|uniref:Multiple sugar transport system substrate-binding protein n=1 Tax=Paenibacillus phyllosphaerae TaxID=274593 RepID=A0A7W5B4X0_9BACL|nr:ABC transporter substrate-binding protein [Paenibacillus phyllosphaerae]MBB3113986.1 multiple sugar transport system substrate-binding protein [Paenibacillus phyllosphaerae]